MSFDFVLASLTLRWLAGWYLGGRAPTLQSAQRGEGARSGRAPAAISVVIPARDEAASLPALLRALASQTCPPTQVIVVDDQSTDATAEIARRAGASVLSSGEVPEGWIGKPWACAQGAAIATGDVLVFLDADTVPSPNCLLHLCALVQRTRGLVSVAPYHQVRRPYELTSALFNLVALMGVGATSLRQNAPATGAFGPCLAMSAEDYAKIGGHASVRAEVLDDVALARVCAQRALPVTNVLGGRELRYRMYPHGFSQLVEGWSKNFAAGAGHTPVIRLVGIVAWLSGLIETGVITTIGAARMLGGGAWPPLMYVLFYALYAGQLWYMLRRIGNQGVVALLHPLATLAFLGICVRSAILHLQGEVTWKGRAIATSARKRSQS